MLRSGFDLCVIQSSLLYTLIQGFAYAHFTIFFAYAHITIFDIPFVMHLRANYLAFNIYLGKQYRLY